jgi:hypothetical protein
MMFFLYKFPKEKDESGGAEYKRSKRKKYNSKNIVTCESDCIAEERIDAIPIWNNHNRCSDEDE